MDLFIAGVIGLAILALLIWLAARLRSRPGRQPQSDRQAMDEAETLTRSTGPFV